MRYSYPHFPVFAVGNAKKTTQVFVYVTFYGDTAVLNSLHRCNAKQPVFQNAIFIGFAGSCSQYIALFIYVTLSTKSRPYVRIGVKQPVHGLVIATLYIIIAMKEVNSLATGAVEAGFEVAKATHIPVLSEILYSSLAYGCDQTGNVTVCTGVIYYFNLHLIRARSLDQYTLQGLL